MPSELKKLNVLMCEHTSRHLHPSIEMVDRTDAVQVVPYVSLFAQRCSPS